MHIVYILKSFQDKNKYYIGITDNLERRLKEHNSASVGYSKRYVPWELETHIVFKDRILAESF